MVRYDDYKDSGINWIGEIPAEWRESRIGNIYDARNEKVSELDYAPLSVTMNGIVPQLETAAKTQDQDSRNLLKLEILPLIADRIDAAHVASPHATVRSP